MTDYIGRMGTIKHRDVLKLEKRGFSDGVIAGMVGMSRAGFGKLRKRMGWVREFGWERSDKGVARKSAKKKRAARNKRARERYAKVDPGKDYCMFCGNKIDGEQDGISAVNEENVKVYCCADCCVDKHIEGEAAEEIEKEVWKITKK